MVTPPSKYTLGYHIARLSLLCYCLQAWKVADTVARAICRIATHVTALLNFGGRSERGAREGGDSDSDKCEAHSNLVESISILVGQDRRREVDPQE
jgi:hypothetical protein